MYVIVLLQKIILFLLHVISALHINIKDQDKEVVFILGLS